jgi:hypothetical protein
VKRSQSIRLILVGGLSAGSLTGCAPKAPVSTGDVYTNNFHVSWAGYYHAPFRGWYPKPYNYQDPQTGMFYYGGQWGLLPHESITNISAPLPEAVQLVLNSDPNISRGGFGGYSSGHSWGSGWSGFHS